MLSTKFNIVADTASNGKIATEKYIERLSRQCNCPNRTYKLILMDLSMPIMNGEIASAEILKYMRHAQL